MTKSEIKDKLKSGDYIILGQMLGCDANTARIRFNRDKPEAIDGLIKIINNREVLISEKPETTQTA